MNETPNPFTYMTDRELFNIEIDKHTQESYDEAKTRILKLCEKFRAEWASNQTLEESGVKPKRTRAKKSSDSAATDESGSLDILSKRIT